ISNFARGGAVSHHNLACWRREDYYGLGPGACGTVNNTRYRNTENTATYIAALSMGQLSEAETEQLSPQARRAELLGLQLRTDEGLPPHLIREQDADFISMLEAEQLAIRTADGKLQLTLKGRLLADEIATGLIM
ncbi:MAG: hypothetical protein IKK15_03260, partial [Akkermansia sp.]|nr:hypothetical protein [Akkermansia sp.]